MTDSTTPLQRLDDAVHEFFNNVGDEGTLAGWALVYQAQMLTTEEDVDPVKWDAGYSIGPGMSPFAVVGLLDHLRGTIGDAYRYAQDDDDDQ